LGSLFHFSGVNKATKIGVEAKLLGAFDVLLEVSTMAAFDCNQGLLLAQSKYCCWFLMVSLVVSTTTVIDCNHGILFCTVRVLLLVLDGLIFF